MNGTKAAYRDPTSQPVGLAARKQAARLLGKVVDEHQSLEALTSEPGGLASYLALPPREKALARAIATTALRHRGLIEFALSLMFDRPPPRKALHLAHTLHVATAQILFMEVPDSAAVDLAVTALSGDNRSARFAGFANAVLRRLAREKASLSVPQTAAITFPRWLAERLRRDHGRQNADLIAEAILREPCLDITVSPKLDPVGKAELAAELKALILPTGTLRTLRDMPVSELPRFDDGIWWVQDAAASIPAMLIGPVRGLKVADLCAAPGGKTAQLASAGAHVTAVDISGRRIERLSENLARLRLDADLVEADILDWSPGVLFDAILLDAPCSSTGTIRRHPDVMWTKTAEDASDLADLQRRLIRKSADLLKPGGILVYANCSILKQEGEDLLASLVPESTELAHMPIRADEFVWQPGLVNGQGALRTLPPLLPAPDGMAQRLGGMDGFFACRFQKRQKTG